MARCINFLRLSLLILRFNFSQFRWKIAGWHPENSRVWGGGLFLAQFRRCRLFLSQYHEDSGHRAQDMGKIP